MSTYTNADWLTQLAAQTALLAAGTITQSQFETAMLPYTNGWIGVAASDSVLALEVSTLVYNVVARDANFDAWVNGTPTGGPYANGSYPLTSLSGGIYVWPCPAAILQTVQHGADAQTGVMFSAVGGYNSNELLQIVGIPGPMILDTGHLSGWAINAPTADSTFTIKRNGAAWGTVTFHAGSSNNITGTFSTGTLALGDALALYAPASIDATLRNFTITIPGV